MSVFLERAHIGLRAALAALFLLAVLAVPATAAEVIRSYTSNLILNKDGSVKVTEIIAVRAEGNKIRRGIYRDIPTVLENPDGSLLHSNLDVLDVERDGKPEPYHTEGITNGVRIYIGDADIFLQPGFYTYTLTYTMTRMARRFEKFDEIYWNATGNYWDFPIEEAVATITLPQGAVISDLSGYTGSRGSTEQAVTITRLADNKAMFRLDHPLLAYQGMTVDARFQKGILTEPGPWQKAVYFLSDHRSQVLPGIGVFLVLVYNLFAWDAVGRDPKKGTIIPRFHPPRTFSPALVHYVNAMGWKQSGWTAFSAALADLAVKGLLVIKSNSKKKISYAETGKDNADLPPGEAVVFGYFRGKGVVKVDKSTGPELASRKSDFIKAIEQENRTVYFNNNFGYVIAGFALSGIVLIGMVVSGILNPVWLIVSLVVGVAIGLVASAFRGLWGGGLTGGIRFIGTAWLVIVLINIFANVVPTLPIDNFNLDVPAVGAVSIVVINVVFAILMRAPTVQGRKVMDEIDGFKMYLETAEKERLNFVGEPEMTVSRYETLLPYAIALGVEKPWSERFQADLSRNAVRDVDRTRGYAPVWYTGSNFSASHLSRDMSAMASGMSAAMIAAQPSSSSSSGGGGGGFSGGGGGGGGGGGW